MRMAPSTATTLQRSPFGSGVSARAVHIGYADTRALRDGNFGTGLPIQTIDADTARHARLNSHQHDALFADGQRGTVGDRGFVLTPAAGKGGNHQRQRNGRYDGKNKRLPAEANVEKARCHGRCRAHREPHRHKGGGSGFHGDKSNNGDKPEDRIKPHGGTPFGRENVFITTLTFCRCAVKN